MWTLSAPAQWTQEIKKSRFLAHADTAESPTAALAFIEKVSEGDARHNCWAYRIGAEYRWSDADEPTGTAGRPILAAIDGQQLDRVIVLVARWFGGIKLGAGGLVRAYGGTAAECLRAAAKRPLLSMQTLEIRLGFEWLGALHKALEHFAANKIEESFDSDGIRMRIQVREDRAEALSQSLRDATRGGVHIAALH